MKKIAEYLQQVDDGLLSLVREECDELLASLSDLTTRIQAKTLKLKKLSQQSQISRRLQTIPGVGPLTAMALEAFAPSMDIFRCGRDFAAWLGLMPKQHSSGGKERLGKVSKAGQVDIRRKLIIGAPLVHVNMHCRAVNDTHCLDRSKTLRGRFLVGSNVKAQAKDARCNSTGEHPSYTCYACAAGQRMARTIWAVLTKEEGYRDPGKIVAV